jgi:hypothetical protein
MKPTIWGPRYWFVIHVATFRYPENPSQNDKDNMRNFVYSLANGILPCPVCRYHFKKYLENPDNNFEEALKNNSNIVKFFWNLHNDVNKRTNKPELSFNDFLLLYKSYESGLDPCDNNRLPRFNINTILILISGIILGGTLVYYLRHK